MKLDRNKIYLVYSKNDTWRKIYFFHKDTWCFAQEDYIFSQTSFAPSGCIKDDCFEDCYLEKVVQEIEEYDPYVLSNTVALTNYLKNNMNFPSEMPDNERRKVIQEYMIYLMNSEVDMKTILSNVNKIEIDFGDKSGYVFK